MLNKGTNRELEEFVFDTVGHTKMSLQTAVKINEECFGDLKPQSGPLTAVDAG